jgi:hypothetical protein
METKGVGQEGMEKCLGSGQRPNWAIVVASKFCTAAIIDIVNL